MEKAQYNILDAALFAVKNPRRLLTYDVRIVGTKNASLTLIAEIKG
jgi:hypothetical protein